MSKYFLIIACFLCSIFESEFLSQAGHYGTVTANNARGSAPTLTLTAPNTCSDVGNLKSGRIEVRNLSAATADNFINSQSCFTIGNTNTNRNVWVQITIPAGSGIEGLYLYSSTSGVTPQPTSSANLRTASVAIYNGGTCAPTLNCGSTWDNAITDIRIASPHIRGLGTERVDVVPGNTYRIEIFTTTFSTDPNYNFDVFVVPLGPIPSNTNCSNAIPFTNQIACNLGAKAACNSDIPDCAFTLENSVFYSFVKPVDGVFQIEITNVQCEGGGNDIQSAIYLASTANCNTLLNSPGSQIDDHCFTGSYTYTINNSDPVGTEYIIWFDGNAGAACTWGVEVVAPCVSPTINLSSVSGSTCSNTPITISGNTFGGGANTVTFTHNGNGSITPSITSSPFSFTYTPSSLDAGNTVTLTATTNSAGAGCDAVFQTYALTVNPIPTANFSGLNGPYCVSDASVTLVPVLSGGSFSGTGVSGNTFNPSVAGQGEHDITYNITVGGCPNSSMQTITVNNPTIPTFAFGTSTIICNDATVPTLPTTSSNGITGTWTPSTVSNSTSDIYTFTPTAGLCATNTTFNVTIETNVTPTFAFGTSETFCNSATVPTLPNSSSNGITGTWSPAAVSNTVSNNYVFTPTAGLCATGTNFNVTIEPNVTPTFSFGTSATVCENGSVTSLPTTSSNGISGTWSPSTVSNTTADVYTFTPTAGICANTTTFTQTIEPNITPTFAFGTSTIICNGATVPTLPTTSSNGITGTWTPSTVSNTTSDIYTFTPTAGLCATNTTFNVTINQLPVLDVSGISLSNPTACAATDGSITGITATGAPTLSYSWNGGASQPSSNLTGVGSGTYNISVTDGNSCTASAGPFSLSDPNPPATPTLSLAPGNICETGSFTINIDAPIAGATYNWTSTPAGYTNTGNSITISNALVGTISYQATPSLAGCIGTSGNISVTVNPLPSISVITPLIVSCNLPIVSLDGSGSSQGTEFTYTWTTSNGVIIGDTDLDTAATSNAGTYNLLVTNTNTNCTSNADIIVTMDTVSPIADAGTDVNFPCGVTTVALDGSASSGTGITYNWTGPTTITNGTTATPDVNGAGQYTLTVTATNGCTDTDVVDVISDVNAPLANAGTGIVITCNNTLPVVLDGSGSDSGTDITYSWSTTGSGNIIDGTTTTPTVDQAGTYEILVTNTSNNCTATATVTITTDTISPIADVSATVSSVINCTSNLVTTLDGSNSTGTGLTYSWTTSNGTIDSQNGANAIVSSAGDYLLTVEGSNGCQDTHSINVTIDTISPIITVAGIDTLNCNISQTTIDASASADIGGSYAWTTTNGSIVSGDNTNVLTVGGAGDYTLTITNSNGCEITESFTVISAPNPIADFTPSTTEGQGPLEVDFANYSSGSNLDYNWDFGDGNSSNDFEPSNTYIEFTTFTTTLIVTDEFGCTDTASVSIIVNGLFPISMPEGFSPNGDNTNDTFVIENIENYPNNIFSVFNRWGNIVFEEAGYLNTWNGTSMAKIKIGGEDLPTGTYFYILDLGEDVIEMERIYKGYIYLNR